MASCAQIFQDLSSAVPRSMLSVSILPSNFTQMSIIFLTIPLSKMTFSTNLQCHVQESSKALLLKRNKNEFLNKPTKFILQIWEISCRKIFVKWLIP